MPKEEKERSKLYKLKPIIDRIPAIRRPEGHVHFKTKMLWLVAILILYYILCNVMIYGVNRETMLDMFAAFRAIMAGASGSLMHLGIGPIVTGSIIMQLFVGAKIFKLDLTDPDDKAIYQGTQKLVIFIMIFIESIPQVYGYLSPDPSFVKQVGNLGLANTLIVTQLIFGCYLVFLMDEVISKWSIGSGVSLFIAAGVSEAIFTGTVNWLPIEKAAEYGLPAGCPAGTIPKTVFLLEKMSLGDLSAGGFENIFIAPPNPIIALLGTAMIFLLVAYLESCRIELPLAHGRVRGARGRYPIKLIYVSVIPVILMSALLANVSMFSLLLWSHPSLSQLPLLGRQWWIGAYQPGETTPYCGLAWYLSPVNGIESWLLPLINPDRYGGYLQDHAPWQLFLRVIVYLSVMVIGCILFGKFWIETTGMGPDDVARQIQRSGMHIPGFRRDPRALRRVLARYIPSVTILSAAFIGALAAGADMIGTVGNTSGTGVLLLVSVIVQFYELIGREQLMEMHPMLRGFFGAE